MYAPAGAIHSQRPPEPGRDESAEHDRLGLLHLADDGTGRDLVAHGADGGEGPTTCLVERPRAGAVREQRGRPRETPQHPVEDAPEQARAERGAQWMAGGGNGIAGAHAARVRVDLNRRPPVPEGDDLAGQPRLAHFDELEHLRREPLDLEHRPADPVDAAGGHAQSRSRATPISSIVRSAIDGSV